MGEFGDVLGREGIYFSSGVDVGGRWAEFCDRLFP